MTIDANSNESCFNVYERTQVRNWFKCQNYLKLIVKKDVERLLSISQSSFDPLFMDQGTNEGLCWRSFVTGKEGSDLIKRLFSGSTKSSSESDQALLTAYLPEKFRRLFFVYKELVDTEYSYLKQLEHILVGFKRPFEQKLLGKDAKAKDIVDTLFANIEDLYDFQRKRLASFNLFLEQGFCSGSKDNDDKSYEGCDNCCDKGCYKGCDKDCYKGCDNGYKDGILPFWMNFLPIFALDQNDVMFKQYARYCRDHQFAITLLQDYYRDPQWKAFFLGCRMLISQDISIEGFLLAPIQRLCRYPLLFKEMVKAMSPDHAAYRLVWLCEERTRCMADQVNRIHVSSIPNDDRVLIFREMIFPLLHDGNPSGSSPTGLAALREEDKMQKEDDSLSGEEEQILLVDLFLVEKKDKNRRCLSRLFLLLSHGILYTSEPPSARTFAFPEDAEKNDDGNHGSSSNCDLVTRCSKFLGQCKPGSLDYKGFLPYSSFRVVRDTSSSSETSSNRSVKLTRFDVKRKEYLLVFESPNECERFLTQINAIKSSF